jgi:hypothetical protein
MNNTIKFIYFFKGDLSSHIDIYKSWIDVVKNDINISMVTIIDFKTYKLQKKLVDDYREQGVTIFIVPRLAKRIYALLYFTYLLLKYQKVIVHLRKQSPQPFDLLKKVFQFRLKYIIEIEGDFESEIEYLSKSKNKYKDGFYDSLIKGMRKNAAILEKQLGNSDGVFAITKELKQLFIDRYTKLNLKDKIHVIPTGFDSNKFYPDNELRIEYRKKYHLEDKFVMIFTGNAFYSWQNIKRSLELFKLIKKESLLGEVFFLLLISKQDHYIVENFIKKLRIDKSDYLLTNVAHKEVNGMLNASDMAILLRENHTLNKVASPGKLGEYLSSGIDVLTTKHIGDYSEKMEKYNTGILIDNIFDDIEVIKKIKSFGRDKSKKEVSKWAVENFSSQSYKKRYIDTLNSLIKDKR